MKIKIMFVLATALLVQAASLAAQEGAALNKVATKRVAFAQSCFWTGEMKLGQTERGKSGFSQRNWRGEVDIQNANVDITVTLPDGKSLPQGSALLCAA